MFPRPLIAAALGLVCALPARAETAYPLTFANCGAEVTIDAAPAGVVSIGQAATEILYALGLGDRVLGTAVWFTAVLPEFAGMDAGVDRLADNDPSFESVVARRPDLVTAQFEWHVGPQGVVATREQFADMGIPAYVLPTDCAGRDAAGRYSPESLYRGIEELARVFDVAGRGAALIADLRAREGAAIARAGALDLGAASAVFWFSSPEMDAAPFVAGQGGVPASMMRALGLRNVVRSDEDWPTVGWEAIARANPTIIVVARMDRRRFEADDVERKLEFLRTDPVTREMDAVRNGRIVVLDAHGMDPSIRNIGALETLASALAEFALP